MSFSKGNIIKKFSKIKYKDKNKHGTIIKFIPDSSLFGKEDSVIDPEKIRNEINLKCYLNAGLKVEFIVDNKKETIQYNLGLSDFLNTEITNPLFNMENIVFKGTDNDDNLYEFALSFNNSTEEKILSFVNSLPTLRGTHETGFKKGLTEAFSSYIKDKQMLSKKDSNIIIKGEDVRRGIVCIINVRHSMPLFDGQTKSELTNKDVDPIIKKIVIENIRNYFDKNPKLAKNLCERVIAFARATKNAKDAMKKIVKVSSSGLGLKVTEKFKDCETDNPDECEIFVIEGDSAAGSVESGRFSYYQAVFPLKGKIKNTYGSKPTTLINNNEINEFLKVEFGTNDIKIIKEMLQDLKNGKDVKIKSKKIVILCDADADGYHIAILFINFVYEHLPELIELGYLYIGVSPFYRVNINNSWRYFMNNQEYSQFLSEVISKHYKVNNPKFSVNKVMYYADDFINEFERIMNKYSVDEEVINRILHNDDYDTLFSEIEELGLDYNESINEFEGLYNNIWHSFNLDDLCEECDELSEIYTFKYLDLTEDNQERFECDIYDGLKMMYKVFKYKRNRIKGKPLPLITVML